VIKMKGSFIQAVLQSGVLCQGILVILLVLSIVSWAIIAHKLRLLRQAKRDSEGFLKVFRRIERLSDATRACRRFEQSPLVKVFRAGYHEFRVQRGEGSSPPDEDTISLQGIDGVRRALQRATSAEIPRLEKGLFFLGTMASTCPFIGLFGTVWGVMNSFISMQTYHSASIAVVGPGIAGALTTTVAGLAAAIPALVAYNYFVNRVKTMASEMENLSSEFISLLERRFVKR